MSGIMGEIISDEEIRLELEAGFKPTAFNTGLAPLPYSDLSDRDFERMIYLLVKSEIDRGADQSFDNIALMQGVGERGRDCVLYSLGAVAGIIQCKNLNSRLSRPALIKEVVKFLLNSILDGGLIPDIRRFTYYIYASGDFSGPAIDLLCAFSSEILVEVGNGKLDGYVLSVVEDYEAFRCFKDCLPLGEIAERLKILSVKSVGPADMTMRLNFSTQVMNAFFNVKTVVEVGSLKEELASIFDDYGLKLLNDDHLKLFQSRLSQVIEGKRFSFGAVDFYGYDKGFFKTLMEGDFKGLMETVHSVSRYMEERLVRYVADKLTSLIYTKVTLVYRTEGEVSGLTMFVVPTYLIRRVLPRVNGAAMAKTTIAKVFPGMEMEKFELYKLVSESMIESVERFRGGDYSQFPNPDPDRKKRLELFSDVCAGVADIEDARRIVQRDYEVISAVLDEIESELIDGFSTVRTIVIKDSTYLDNPKEVDLMAKTFKALK